MKKVSLVSVLILFALISFAQNPLTINGNFKNPPKGNIILKHYDAARQYAIDSTAIRPDGGFVFSVKNPQGGLYLLEYSGQYIGYVFPQKAQNVNWSADFNDIVPTTIISGSDMSVHMIQLMNRFAAFSARTDSLESLIEEIYSATGTEESVSEQIAAYEAIQEEEREFVRQEIKAKPSSIAITIFMEKLDEDDDLEYYEMLDKGIYDAYAGDPLAEDFHRNVERMRKTRVGAMAPEISLPSPEGTNVSLSSQRGKVVLIDFWASWCGPCRRENPNVVRMYSRFKDKGFEIYAVSLDRTRKDWLGAINDDKLTWIHVSDVKFWSSEAARTYGVSSIPYTVLVDREGRIIAKGLRGKELEKKLEEILN